MRDETWVDRYGKGVSVSDMSEEYAKNILRKLLREKRQQTAVAKMFSDWTSEQFDIKQRTPV